MASSYERAKFHDGIVGHNNQISGCHAALEFLINSWEIFVRNFKFIWKIHDVNRGISSTSIILKHPLKASGCNGHSYWTWKEHCDCQLFALVSYGTPSKNCPQIFAIWLNVPDFSRVRNFLRNLLSIQTPVYKRWQHNYWRFRWNDLGDSKIKFYRCWLFVESPRSEVTVGQFKKKAFKPRLNVCEKYFCVVFWCSVINEKAN